MCVRYEEQNARFTEQFPFVFTPCIKSNTSSSGVYMLVIHVSVHRVNLWEYKMSSVNEILTLK